MPAIVTTSRSKAFSRVNSFKREWGDEDDSKAQRGTTSSQPADWSSSPPRVARKGIVAPSPRAASPPPMQDPFETAADRRRKAILAAMSGDQNSAPPPKPIAKAMPNATYPPTSASSRSAGSSTAVASSSSRSAASSANVGSFDSRRAPLQELPSLPSLSGEKKRSMPWDQDQTVKKTARTTSSKSNKSDASAGSMNILQKISLSQEQQKVLQLVVEDGKNIFFTGSAGTGKSVLLREIIKSLRKKHVKAPDAVAVTASTGIAACNIGGVTLHSFGGAGLCLENPDVLVSKIRKNKKAAARWVRTKVLIIDEVSMVDGALFDKFCKIGQKLRKNDKPFGGIQIIVTGDFFQLPPVTKGGGQTHFCFEAMTWAETINMSVNLTKVFRQKDQRFIDMLNEMRFGKMSQDTISSFRALSRPIKYDDEIAPTELFPRREDVEKSNMARLAELNTEGYSYASNDGGNLTDPAQRDKMLANFMAPQHITLKVGAQVMYIKNLDDSLVNGSMGTVIGFAHKGMFIQDLQGKWVQDDNYEGLNEDERENKDRMKALQISRIAPGTQPLPIVKFKIPGGGFREQQVETDQFKTELPTGEVQVSRQQLPLILAWAMSIHKSQGQTLERVKVDLGKVFEKGQAYVALSRATRLDGLQVLGFNGDKVQAHRKVAIWSQTLKDLNTV